MRVRPRFRLLPTGVEIEAGDKWDNSLSTWGPSKPPD